MTKAEVKNELTSPDTLSLACLELIIRMPGVGGDTDKAADIYIDKGIAALLVDTPQYQTQIENDDIPGSIMDYTMTEIRQFIKTEL